MMIGSIDGEKLPDHIQQRVDAAEAAGYKAFKRGRPRNEVDRFCYKYACIDGHWRFGWDKAAAEEKTG